MATSEPIRNRKQVKQMANYWLRLGNGRNYLLIILGVNTALRSGDFLGLRWDDVFDFESGMFRSHLVLTEKKTGKEKVIAINPTLTLPTSKKRHNIIDFISYADFWST